MKSFKALKAYLVCMLILTVFICTSPAVGATFRSSSFWYSKIPANVQLNSNSDNYVKEFMRQLSAHYGTVNINTTKFSAPVYLADASTPKVVVTEWDCQHKRPIAASSG
jgi:hypothetical protein